MMERTEELGISDRFIFTGKVDHEEIPDYLSLSEIFLFTSLREGHPRAPIEAENYGNIVIASNFPSAREIVRDGETGFIYPIGDIETLTRLTLKVAGGEELRNQMKLNQQDVKSARERYGIPEMSALYSSFLESMVSEN
jgi:glycosyltransferase involved in cell wall biosynthesis